MLLKKLKNWLEQNLFQTKKLSQISLNQDQQQISEIDFIVLEKKIFRQEGEKIYIGGILITEQMRSLLRDQAKNFQTTNLFEIISSTVTNEASNLLLQSSTLEHLQYGKALHYWNKILIKTINALAK